MASNAGVLWSNCVLGTQKHRHLNRKLVLFRQLSQTGLVTDVTASKKEHSLNIRFILSMLMLLEVPDTTFYVTDNSATYNAVYMCIQYFGWKT